ncbi:MAG: hypothetical protein ACYC8T_29275 [Myxococcaceae bacterium]
MRAAVRGTPIDRFQAVMCGFWTGTCSSCWWRRTEVGRKREALRLLDE